MGYGGVISLKQTIHRLLDSSKFTLDSSTREILGFAYKEATSLQQLLGDCDGRGKRRLDRLDGQVRDTVHKLEDFLELHQSDLFLDEDNLLIHSERVRQEINWFSERAKKLGEDYGAEADEEEDDAAPASSSNTGFCEEMVGFSDDLRSMERYVTSTLRPDDWGIMMIVGAAGSGRSLVAKKVLDDVMSRGELCLDYGVWVRVGPKYERERILQLILSQILMIDNRGVAGSEELAKRCLWSRLKGRRYMIVLDDVCDTDIFDYLINMFPVQNNGSVVLVTTGAMVVRNHVRPYYVYRMCLYGVNINLVDEFWDFMRYALFRVQPVPPELEEAGKKIVWNCRGLRLCMSKVLLYLWSAERSPEAWNEIAFDQHHPLFQIADEFLEDRKICCISPKKSESCSSSVVAADLFHNDRRRRFIPQRLSPPPSSTAAAASIVFHIRCRHEIRRRRRFLPQRSSPPPSSTADAASVVFHSCFVHMNGQTTDDQILDEEHRDIQQLQEFERPNATPSPKADHLLFRIRRENQRDEENLPIPMLSSHTHRHLVWPAARLRDGGGDPDRHHGVSGRCQPCGRRVAG